MARRWFSTRQDQGDWGAPITWQGWAVVLLWLGTVLFGGLRWANGGMSTDSFSLVFIIASLLAVTAYWFKGARHR